MRIQLSKPPKPEQIKNARLDSGLTQAEASKLCMVSERTWRRWESGVTEMNSLLFQWFNKRRIK